MFEFIVHKFYEGGPLVMGSIFFVLGISLVIVIERTYRFWVEYDLENSENFMLVVQRMVMADSIENALRLCQKARPKLIPTILSQGLKRANETPQEIENAMEHATHTVLPKVSRRVGLLGTTANVATLLGLLGTIFGLMKSFGAAASASGAQKQTILAEGIAEALTATSFGLGTALLCLLAHGILTAKQQALVSSITRCSAHLSDLLYTRKIKIKEATESNKEA